MTNVYADQIIRARSDLVLGRFQKNRAEDAAEGGCGVLGFAANIPIAGRHVLTASHQMHNRGNGKGGGIAMVGLDPQQAYVDAQTLQSHFMLQIALLDNKVQAEIEDQFITPNFDIRAAYALDHLDDYREIPGLPVRPPDIWRYFVRVKPTALEQFAVKKGLTDLPQHALEEEFIYQNSTRLNRAYYASLGDKRAFVISHGRNLSVLKIVGYAEDVVAYYRLEDQTAHVWIAHQRYPTKGRVWHPGGAHPFIGLNEALVHNGDFANYHSVSEYLRQRNIDQLFLTDTEVSVQLFDLWNRVYGYPLEITLEAMAPTTEFDFEMLPDQKKALYRAVQRTHMHGSPDGPWFFIVARSLTKTPQEDHESELVGQFELLGITDTSMLRPQVFALFENRSTDLPVQVGLIASERQAINACLRSISTEDERFQPSADRYWVARGGSHTDGGAFRFTVTIPTSQDASGQASMTCANKFGQPVTVDGDKKHVNIFQVDPERASTDFRKNWQSAACCAYDNGGAGSFWCWLALQIPKVSWEEFAWGIDWLKTFAGTGENEWEFALEVLNRMHDRRYDPGPKKRASMLSFIDSGLAGVLEQTPGDGSYTQHLNWGNRNTLVEARSYGSFGRTAKGETETTPVLVIDAVNFPAEGDDSAARWIVRGYQCGWRRIIVHQWRGGRFAGCGIGPASEGLKLDLYGDVGDYAASGLDGAEITIHGDGQDQLGQIIKSGKLVIHGDAGQTFLYGAKGGDIYVMGSVAGRPLINAVGKPRAVINGTCLDYLAESFMAGDPRDGGGFVILNGVVFNESGRLIELETPYPGGNLFSLASGGAIYLRDPRQRVLDDQLNGGAFAPINEADWALIEPHLRENERLFGIRVDDLLTFDDEQLTPGEVYRKIEVRGVGVLREDSNR